MKGLKKSIQVSVGLFIVAGLCGCSSTGFFRNRANDYLVQPVAQTPALKTPASMQAPVSNPAFPIPQGVSDYPANGTSSISPPGLDHSASDMATQPVPSQSVQVSFSSQNQTQQGPQNLQFSIPSQLKRANTGAGLLILETSPAVLWSVAPGLFANSQAQFEGVDQKAGFIFFKAHPGAPTQLIHVMDHLGERQQGLSLVIYDTEGKPDLSNASFALLQQIQRNLSADHRNAGS